MKKFFTLLTLTVFSTCLWGQTTTEEYNYVTKGYQIQISSGLDMKKGYRLVDLHESSVETAAVPKTIKRKMSFKGLYREADTTPCAIMIIYNRSDNDFTDYICIPHFNSSAEIWNLYFEKIKSYTDGGAEAMLWGLGKCASFFAKNN